MIQLSLDFNLCTAPIESSAPVCEETEKRVLTVKQPWAWAIVSGHKTIENRVWPTNYRGKLYIHAGKSYDKSAEEYIKNLGIDIPKDLPKGGIVGHCELVDCGNHAENPWAMDDHKHWLLADAKTTEFQPMNGKLGIWKA